MQGGEHDTIVAALREAPYEPARWDAALDVVAALCGGASAQILSFGTCRFRPIIAPGFSDDEIAGFVALEGADPKVNHGLGAVMRSSIHSVIQDVEYISPDQRRRDRLYHEFFARFDGDHIASGTLAKSDAAVCNLNIFLPARRGPLDDAAKARLRCLLPYFTDAIRLSTRLEHQAAVIAGAAWEQVGEPAVICDGSGRIAYANALADQILARGALSSVNGRLTSPQPRLAAWLERVLLDATTHAPRPASILCDEDGRLMIIDVMPLPSEVSRFTPSAVLLVRQAPGAARLDEALLSEAFNLTPSEHQVAVGLMDRLSSSQIAERRQVSLETVNTQVKSILAKTGCTTRAEATLALQPFLVRRARGAG